MLPASIPLAPIAAASPAFIAALLFLRIRGVESYTTVGISCWGVGNEFEYVNNTRCPGSNACCGFNDTCLSNGLCHGANDPVDIFIRGPCAVRPYDKETCAKICVYDEIVEGNFLPRVRICDNDGSYCCSNDDNCCVQGRGVFLDEEGNIVESAASTTISYGPERTAATFEYTAPSVLLSATADPVSETSTTEPTATATKSDDESAEPTGVASEQDGGDSGGDSSGDSGTTTSIGLKVGLGLGIPLAAIIAGAAVWLFMIRRGKKKDDGYAPPAPAPHSTAEDSHSSGYYAGTTGWKSPPGSYMTTTTYPSELGGGHPPVEMSA